MEKMLSPKDVCKILDISLPLLYRLLKEKKINANRVDWQWRFTERQVQEYLDRNQNIEN